MMKFSRPILASCLVAAHRAAAFAPSRAAFVPSRLASQRAVSSSTVVSANVLKLSDPTEQLLDKVDIFIFDCDGVIWRVCIGASRLLRAVPW